MNLQSMINPCSVSEMPDKRENRLLSSAYTEKRVYYTLQIHETFPFIVLRKFFTVYRK